MKEAFHNDTSHVWMKAGSWKMTRKGPGRDVAKEARWQKLIGEATRSGLSIREFCRRRRLDEGQFYAWRLTLQKRRGERGERCGHDGGAATFALVSADGEGESAGIELVLGNGRKLRISRGVDAETLKTVVGALSTEA